MKMKKIIVIVVLFTLALSCKNNPVPSDAIKKETFINILVDIHIAEGIYYEQMRIKYDSLGSTSMYLSILEKYKVSEKEMLITTKSSELMKMRELGWSG